MAPPGPARGLPAAARRRHAGPDRLGLDPRDPRGPGPRPPAGPIRAAAEAAQARPGKAPSGHPPGHARAAAARNVRAATVEARARALEAIERRLDRPLPGARGRIERRVVAAAREARATYRARPWPGRVALITSTEFREKPTYAAWPLRAEGGVEVRELPAGHVEMLREPGASLLARCIEDLIDEALAIE